ncbi:mannose-p-dolichol utilization defect 1 lec35 -related [Anaeramoeba flamelloides]|uniref:Mannose-P-dolichol utilization defect 1 protein homolog n=1 Tax=Anaeramoeba flamelloides TaxID=1746091 RepID=A0ABQ8XVR4_9EUKA|nr:mannose-p-dolichol utilization defect 1 lec35 -related [Anaeramoeba flamelloides]
MGYGIVFGAGILKLPQIFSILKKKSTKGLSKMYVVLETLALTFALSYGYGKGKPFKTWGENGLLLAQNMIILLLLLIFSSAYIHFFATVGIVASYLVAVYQKMVPMEYLDYVQMMVVPTVILSRFPQILSNFKNKGCGALSLISFLLALVGNLVRFLTVLKETSDILMMSSSLISLLLNAIIISQIIMYGEGKDTPKENEKKKDDDKDEKDEESDDNDESEDIISDEESEDIISDEEESEMSSQEPSDEN